MTASITLPSRLRASLLLVIAVLALAVAHPVSAQSGADVEAGIAGKRTVKLGQTITYAITATNIGDATATGVQIQGGVPDWFEFDSLSCAGGLPDENLLFTCNYPDLAPGASVSMTFTVTAVAPERHMFELGVVSANNDTNLSNNTAKIKVNMTQYCHGCKK